MEAGEGEGGVNIGAGFAGREDLEEDVEDGGRAVEPWLQRGKVLVENAVGCNVA